MSTSNAAGKGKGGDDGDDIRSPSSSSSSSAVQQQSEGGTFLPSIISPFPLSRLVLCQTVIDEGG